jgi:hypothetical protein
LYGIHSIEKTPTPLLMPLIGQEIPQLRQAQVTADTRYAADSTQKGDGYMNQRAIVCGAAIILAQLAAGTATAQSNEPCDRPGCSQSESPGLIELFGGKKLDLFGFMRGTAKEAEEPPPVSAMADQEEPERVVAKRHARKKSAKKRKSADGPKVAAERPNSPGREVVNPAPAEVVQPAQQATMPATSFASPTPSAPLPFSNSVAGEDRVQVVSADELNVIDLAMNRSQGETVGAGRFSDFPEYRMASGGMELVGEAAGSGTGSMQKLADARAFPEGLSGSDQPKTETPPGDTSWLGWMWSAIGNSFTRLAASVRHVFG